MREHGARVQEIDCSDPGTPSARELPQASTRRRGAGSMRAARRISHTMDGATVTPSLTSSLRIRRRPHSGWLSGPETRTLAKLTHDLGLIVYYSDDEGLGDIVVLNPEWLTRAISHILEDKPTRQADGILDHKRLRQIWGDRGGYERPALGLREPLHRLRPRSARRPLVSSAPAHLIADAVSPGGTLDTTSLWGCRRRKMAAPHAPCAVPTLAQKALNWGFAPCGADNLVTLCDLVLRHEIATRGGRGPAGPAATLAS